MTDSTATVSGILRPLVSEHQLIHVIQLNETAEHEYLKVRWDSSTTSHEDAFEAKIVDEALAEIDREGTIPWDEVKADLGL